MEQKDDINYRRDLVGKMVVSKSGKKFGELSSIYFDTKSGELMYLLLANPTAYARDFELDKDEEGNMLIPFNAVMALGDFIVVAEEDIL